MFSNDSRQAHIVAYIRSPWVDTTTIMTLNAVHTPDNLGIKSKYHLIIRRLQSTLAKHISTFPQLSALEIYLDIALPEAERDEDYLQRLDGLCSHLHELSTSSYVIRHLHYNLCADVEAVRNSAFLFNQEEHYLTLPD
ncbi:hypothetical protein [Pontibacter brevis]